MGSSDKLFTVTDVLTVSRQPFASEASSVYTVEVTGEAQGDETEPEFRLLAGDQA